MDRVKCLRSVLEVARHGSYSQAAGTLGISKSGLSKQVSSLERLIGFELFRRRCSGMQLTSQGRIWIKRVDSALEALECLLGADRSAGIWPDEESAAGADNQDA